MNKAKITLTALMIALAEPSFSAIDISGVTQVVAVEGANAIAAIGVAIIGVFSLMVVIGLLIRSIKGSRPLRVPARSIHTPVYRGGRNGKARDYVPSVHERINPIVRADQLARDNALIDGRNYIYTRHPALFGREFGDNGMPLTIPFGYPAFLPLTSPILDAEIDPPILDYEIDYDDIDSYADNDDLASHPDAENPAYDDVIDPESHDAEHPEHDDKAYTGAHA